MYGYTLIVSQYYHTHHQFIVKYDDNFMEKAKSTARELIKYKRDEDCKKEEYLGDLAFPFSSDRIRARYNINDICGDIYFINCETVEEALRSYSHYIKKSMMTSKGYKKKSVLEAIDVHHQVKFVKAIIKRHFEIV